MHSPAAGSLRFPGGVASASPSQQWRFPSSPPSDTASSEGSSSSSLLGHGSEEKQQLPSHSYYPSSSTHRRQPSQLSTLTAGFPGRRRLIPLVLLAGFTLWLLSSSVEVAENADLGYSYSESSPRTPSEQDEALPRMRYSLAKWIPTSIFRRPSSYISSSKTSSITASDNRIKRANWQSPTPSLPVDATLSERLQDLWDAPLSEPANWVQWNAQTCSRERVKQQQNDWITQDSALLWASLNSSSIREKRKAMVDYLVEAEKQGLMNPENCGSGRGLVFTAGNADTFSRVHLTLKLLRDHFNTNLPAEIFSFPGEAPPADILEKLQDYNVTLRYIEHASRDTKRVKNYQIKSDAIVASSFAEVLYLDSDNMPAAYLGNHDGTFDPAYISKERLIWEAPAYKRLGAMFWPDYWKTGPMNPIWAIIGTQCRDEFEQEAGQILIDKRRHMDALLLSNWMLDDWKFWFRLSDGDKDIFRFAFLALRKRWAVPGRYVAAAALPSDSMSGFCGHTMLQHDHLGYPMFVHQNLLKQIPSGIGRGYTWGRNRQTGLFNGGDPLIEGGEGSGDVEADMLANAQSDGTAIVPAVTGVRYRAALERGVYTRFHGGSVSALCVDMHYEDPRTLEEKERDFKVVNSTTAVPPKVKKDDGKFEDPKMESLTYGVGIDGEPVWINWDQSPLMVGYWQDEPNLKDFEEQFYNAGGSPNGAGFV